MKAKFLILNLFLSAFGEVYAGSKVTIIGALEPAFYFTGDYKSHVKSATLHFWPSRYFGISASAGKFEFLLDRVTWFRSVQAEIYAIEASARTVEWYRQRIDIGLGYSFHHKRADETFLEISTKDSAMIQKLQLEFMQSPIDSLGAHPSNFRMRSSIRDENGYYRYGISRLRNYSLNGISAYLGYSVRPFGLVCLKFFPSLKYYPSEPLFIWSLGFGIELPIIDGK